MVRGLVEQSADWEPWDYALPDASELDWRQGAGQLFTQELERCQAAPAAFGPYMDRLGLERRGEVGEPPRALPLSVIDPCYDLMSGSSEFLVLDIFPDLYGIDLILGEAFHGRIPAL